MPNVNEIHDMMNEGATPQDIMGLVALDPASLSEELVEITIRTCHWLLDDILKSFSLGDWTRAMCGASWLGAVTGHEAMFSLGNSINMHATTLYGYDMPDEPPYDLLEAMHKEATAQLGVVAPPT